MPLSFGRSLSVLGVISLPLPDHGTVNTATEEWKLRNAVGIYFPMVIGAEYPVGPHLEFWESAKVSGVEQLNAIGSAHAPGTGSGLHELQKHLLPLESPLPPVTHVKLGETVPSAHAVLDGTASDTDEDNAWFFHRVTHFTGWTDAPPDGLTSPMWTFSSTTWNKARSTPWYKAWKRVAGSPYTADSWPSYILSGIKSHWLK